SRSPSPYRMPQFPDVLLASLPCDHGTRAMALFALFLDLTRFRCAQARQLQEPAWLRPPALRLQQRMHLARGRHQPFVLVGLVVLFDLLQLVAIVAHESVRLAQSLGRDIPLPVDPLKPRAIAEMKAGHWIDGIAVAILDVEEVVASEPHEQRAHHLVAVGVDPVRLVQQLKTLALAAVDEDALRLGSRARKPARELGHRRQRHKGPEAGAFLHQVLDYLL